MRYLISDVHGNKDVLRKLIIESLTDNITLIGDIGFGFGITMDWFKLFPDKKITLLQGNHDNAQCMYSDKNVSCITTFNGYRFEYSTGTLHIPGAYSYDKKYRINGISWWDNEEMNVVQLQSLIDFVANNVHYIKNIISHDAPLSMYYNFFPETVRSRTNVALDTIKEIILENEVTVNWYHGHLHYGYSYRVGNLNIIGLQMETGMYLPLL
jgi:hypothetical protein